MVTICLLSPADVSPRVQFVLQESNSSVSHVNEIQPQIMTVPSPLSPRDSYVFYNSCWESHFIMQTQSVFSKGMRIWIPGHSQEWEMKGSWPPAALEKGFSIITLCCKGRIICICFIWKWAFFTLNEVLLSTFLPSVCFPPTMAQRRN